MFHRLSLTFAWCCAMLCILLCPLASGHKLNLDQLVLWPDLDNNRLRGELLFDPEYTRSDDTPPNAQSERAVLAFLRNNLSIRVNGQLLTPDYQVRELWVRGGATAGDLTVFSAPLPPDSSSLQVSATRRWKSLVVSISQPRANSRQQARSWLLNGGDETPAYGLAIDAAGAPLALGWKKGAAEIFETSLAKPGPPPVSAWASAFQFIKLGFFHILPEGLDHILFVVALVLGAAFPPKRLFLQLTVFTCAHTVTLVMAHFGVVKLSPQFVEPVIAFSVAAVALENLYTNFYPTVQAKERASNQRFFALRLAVIFAFGLVHGMGFASTLQGLSLAENKWFIRLLAFNGGIEMGQIVVAITMTASLYCLRTMKQRQRYLIVPGSILISGIGLFWGVQRIVNG